LKLGDLDNDGDIDLAVANIGSDNVSVLLGNGDGSFRPAANYRVGDEPISAALGDLDNDGDLDLAVTNKGSDNVSVLINVTNLNGEIILGDFDGDGIVTYNDLYNYFLPAFGQKSGDPSFVPDYDMNQDGLIDMLDYTEWYSCYMEANL
jgi:hypothetical protein